MAATGLIPCDRCPSCARYRACKAERIVKVNDLGGYSATNVPPLDLADPVLVGPRE